MPKKLGIVPIGSARESDSPPLQLARAAFRAAEYDRCRAFLSLVGDEHPAERAQAALLEARLARLERRYEEWYAAATLAERAHPDPAGRLFATMLRATAAKRLGHLEEAATLRAAVESGLAEITPAAGLVVYHLALDAWEERDYGRAERIIERNLAHGVEVAQSLTLLGWIEVKRENFAASIVPFSKALKLSHDEAEPDRLLQARTIHALGVAASELIDLPLGRRVRREFEAMTWPAELAVEKFLSVMTLHYLALLEGDLDRAWLLSRESVSVAPTPAYRAVAEVYAAVASRFIGDRGGARIQLEQAWKILRSERWAGTETEARGALTSFAIEGARTMPAEARKAVTLYQSIAAKRNPLSAVDQDRRIVAFEATAAARISEVLGRRAEAIAQYRFSLQIWTELRCAMRAAEVGMDLVRLTGDSAYRAPVDAALKRAPKAWLGRELERLAGPIAALTAAERTVLIGLLEGKRTKAIAAELDRSEFTVTNHTSRVLAAFGVASRSALIAVCGELGITPDEVRAAPRKPRRQGPTEDRRLPRKRA
jgi:DNA-binding NarL/FixJ family response regulator